MSAEEKRKVGKRGQVTLPKGLRERLGISHGDEVVVREKDGKVVIETSVSKEDLAEGYRRRSERMEEIAEEMQGTSDEADDQIGDVPEW
jgi:AbrB family looped-hinge helix DNA binding protein